MQARELTIGLCRSPLAEPSWEVLELEGPETVARLAARVGWSAPAAATHVTLDGYHVPTELWSTVVPKSGSHLVLVRRPNEAFTIAIGAFFAGLAQGATAGLAVGGTLGVGAGAASVGFGLGAAIGTGVLSTVVSFGINKVASALIGQPDQDIDPIEGGSESPTLQGAGNGVRQNAPFPYVAGSFRFQPPFGSFDSTMVRGSESVLMVVFILGRGNLRVPLDQIMIGDVPITQFKRARVFARSGPESFGLQIFTNKVFQSALNTAFQPLEFGSAEYRSPYVQFRVQGQGHGKLGVDFNCPTGIGILRDKGPRSYFFGMQIEFRRVGDVTWADALDVSDFGPLGLEGTTGIFTVQGEQLLQFIGASQRPFQTGFTWSVSGTSEDQWDVRMRRIEFIDPRVLPGGPETNATFGTLIWFAVKGLNFLGPPLDTTGVSTLELEIPLDTQFNGLSQNLSVLAERFVRTYDPSNLLGFGIDADGWTLGSEVSSNPAAIIRDMLQGQNNRRPLPDSRINIQALTDFFVYCRDYNDGGLVGGLRFDFVFDARIPLFDACNLVAQAGRGRFGQDSQGRFTVIFDGPKPFPIGKITAANCRAFQMELIFPREVNAIRAQYVDRDAGFDLDAELEVYADGFSADGTGGTEIADENTFETLSLPGTTTSLQAFLLARYFLADRALRRRVFTCEIGPEHLQLPVGSLVTFSHPGALIGLAWGRIKSVSNAMYRDYFDRDQPQYSNDERFITGGVAEFGNTFGPIAGGEGAARVTSLTSGAVTVTTLFSLLGTLDFLNTRFHFFGMAEDASSLSASDGLRLRVYGPTMTDWKEWRFGTGDGVNTTTLQLLSVSLGTTPADASSGTFNPAMVKQYEITANVVGGAANRTFRYSNFHIVREDNGIQEIELDQLVPMGATILYEIEYRREKQTGFLIDNEIHRFFLRRLTDYAIGSDRFVSFVYLETPIGPGTFEPSAGKLYSFGENNISTARCIIKEKRAGTDQTAQVVMVEEAPGVHSVAGDIPEFAPASSFPVPIRQVAPAPPQLFQAVSDERAILILSDGTLKPRILIHVLRPLAFGRPQPDFYALHYRRVLPSALQGVSAPRVEAFTSELILDDVEEGATYEISIQSVTRQGTVSEPLIFQHLVIGKLGLPPDVQEFRLEGQFLRWSLPFLPPDLAGFEIRRGPLGGTFDQARSIHAPMLVASPPFDVSRIPDPGISVLYITALDTIGNRSANPQTLSGFLGAFPEQNIVRTIDIDAAGFPIVDLVEEILDGFEGLQAKAVPDFMLEIPAPPPGDPQNMVSMIVTDFFSGAILQVERTLVDAGMQALKVTDTGGVGPLVLFQYIAPQNVTDRRLRSRFRGGKAAVTWSVRYRVIQADDSSKSSRWDVAGLGTLSYVDAEVDLSTAPDATTNGGADLTKIGVLEISVVCSSPAAGDFVHFDDVQWVGGTVNGVEVVGGDLKTMNRGDSFWSADPASSFWNASGAADFWAATTYLDGRYTFLVEVLSSDIPASVRLSFSDPGVDFQVFYRSPSMLELSPFPGFLPEVEEGFYTFQIRLAGGFVQASIDQLSVILDVEDQVEEFDNFSVSNTGTVRLPLTKTFRSIESVKAQVRGSTTGFAKILDFVTTLGAGPSVQVVNLSDTRISASADFTVRGVRG